MIYYIAKLFLLQLTVFAILRSFENTRTTMANKLTSEDIAKTGHLARLALSEHEKSEMADKMNSIFDLFQQIEATDTTHLQPMAHPIAEFARLRPDVVTETNQRDLLQAGTKTAAGLFLVPKVIE